MNKIVKEKLKEAILLFIIIIAFGSVLAIMLKYENEGEKNMPFNLTEMLVISSVDETPKAENLENYKRNLDLNQYNDFYLEFKRNSNFKETVYIENIIIENIEIKNGEGKNINIYVPCDLEEKKFSYEDKYKVENSFTYKGSSQDNEKKLEIGNQGGRILFRIVNQNVGEYISNDDGDISYDGTLLKKIGISNENIEIGVSFDIVIQTNLSNYRGKIDLDLPCGNILEEGVCNIKQTDFKDVAFKREK